MYTTDKIHNRSPRLRRILLRIYSLANYVLDGEIVLFVEPVTCLMHK